MKSLSPTNIDYFDYNATHPPLRGLIEEAYSEYLEDFYNPSGATRFSLKNQGRIESVRKYFAELTNSPEKNIVFCSTGTEANYLLIRALRERFPETSAVIVSPFEHASMYSALRDHHFEMKVLSSDPSGTIDLEHLEELLKLEPLPIVCLHTGNETGVIQPTLAIKKLAHRFHVDFLSDLMQGFGKTNLDFEHFSGFSFSSHKIGGGMGAALTGFKFPLEKYALFGGGNQENGHRAGTENLPAILSFRSASEFQIKHLIEKNKKLSQFRTMIETELETLGCKIIARDAPRVPNTSFILLPIEEIDFFLLGMEEKGIMISTGSSCKSRAREASASLIAMGYSKEESLRCIRISTGSFTTNEEVIHLTETIKELLTTFGNVG